MKAAGYTAVLNSFQRQTEGEENMAEFKIVSDYRLMGDQPQAVEKIAAGIMEGKRHQTLMGVTGSGKTFSDSDSCLAELLN